MAQNCSGMQMDRRELRVLFDDPIDELPFTRLMCIKVFIQPFPFNLLDEAMMQRFEILPMPNPSVMDSNQGVTRQVREDLLESCDIKFDFVCSIEEYKVDPAALDIVRIKLGLRLLKELETPIKSELGPRPPRRIRANIETEQACIWTQGLQKIIGTVSMKKSEFNHRARLDCTNDTE